MRDWSVANGGTESVTVLDATELTLAVPRSVVSLPDVFSERVRLRSERYLVPVPGATLLNINGLIGLPDGSYSVESVYTVDLMREQLEYRHRDTRPRVKKAGDFFSLLNIWSRDLNYYHWMHDTLTRAHAVLDFLPSDTFFVVRNNLGAFHRRTLAIVGIPADRIVEYPGDEIWEVETLHFAPKTTNSGADRPEVVAWLRQRFAEAYDLHPNPAWRRLFVTRRNAQQRRIQNEAEINELVALHGFEIVEAEALQHRDQARLFHEAEVIVAPHGAGLTNLLFSQPGARVVELLEPSKWTHAYVFWSLADACGLEYWHVPAETVPRKGFQPDMRVPIDLLAETFDQMGLKRP